MRFACTSCGQDTHSQHTSVQYSLFTSAERIARAWLKSHGLQCHLCAPEKSLSTGPHISHPLLLSHLPFTTSTSSSSFTLSSYHDTRTRSTIRTTRCTPRTPSTSSTPSRLSQSTSSAIKSHSGVKTCRVAETRTRQLPQVMSPKSL